MSKARKGPSALVIPPNPKIVEMLLRELAKEEQAFVDSLEVWRDRAVEYVVAVHRLNAVRLGVLLLEDGNRPTITEALAEAAVIGKGCEQWLAERREAVPVG